MEAEQKKTRVKVIADDGLPYDIKKHEAMWFADEGAEGVRAEERREGEPDDLFKERKVACIQWLYYSKRWAECLEACNRFLGEKAIRLQKSEMTEVNDFKDRCTAKLEVTCTN